jgi:hypothetical protein
MRLTDILISCDLVELNSETGKLEARQTRDAGKKEELRLISTKRATALCLSPRPARAGCPLAANCAAREIQWPVALLGRLYILSLRVHVNVRFFD